jgi:hypothetical protein
MFDVLLKGWDMEEVEVGEVLESILDTHPYLHERVDVPTCSNEDINYLQRRTGLSRPFLRRMLRIFGEVVVLESLRRFSNGYQYAPGREEAVFVGICKAVEGITNA